MKIKRETVFALAAATAVSLSSSAADRWVAVNEDNDHYFTTRGEEGMTVEALEAYIDRMAGGKVTHFFMCPSGQLPKLSDRENRFTVRLGARPVGEVSVFIGVLQEGEFAPEVTLNGVKATSSRPSGMEISGRDHPEKRQKYNGRRYFFPSSAVHPGADNVIALKPSETKMSIVWCEIMLEAVR